jgi:outer membrane protein TolC
MRAIELLYDAAKQEQIVALCRTSYLRQEKFLKATKVKEKIGLTNGMDVYLAEVELKQAEDCLNQATDNLMNARDLLREILALPHDTLFSVTVPLDFTVEEWNLDEAIEVAFTNRIEIDQGMDQVKESQRMARLSKNELLPDLNFVLDYSNLGYGEEFTGSFGRKRESRWGIGFTSSSGSNQTREKTAYERVIMGVEGAKRAFNDIKKDIVLDVKRTLRAMERMREKITLQRKQIKNLEEGLHLAKAKFLREYVTSLELIQAEKAFQASQINLTCSLIDHEVGKYRLKAVLGLLIEKQL